MKAFYMTLGSYDMVAVIEAPDDAAFAKVMLVGSGHSLNAGPGA